MLRDPRIRILSCLETGKPFVTVAESPDPIIILWQLGVARKLLFFEVSALATKMDWD